MSRLCGWYTETPTYQECGAIIPDGETRCEKHRIQKARQLDLTEAAKKIVRDRAHGYCERCGAPGVEIHHIRELSSFAPWEKNLANHPNNLQLLCFNCHAQLTKDFNSSFSSVVDDNDFRTSARSRKRRRLRARGFGV